MSTSFSIICIIYFILSKISSNTYKAIDDKLKEISNFDKEQFLNQCLENFIKLQKAWSDFDYNEMRMLLSDEIYNNYVSLLTTLSLKKQKNIYN